jgi:hypothetical protein
MTPELRSGIFDVDPLLLGADQLEEIESEEESKLSNGTASTSGNATSATLLDVEPDEAHLQTLISMGYGDSLCRAALINTKNKGIMEAFEWIEVNMNSFVEPVPPSAQVDKHQDKLSEKQTGRKKKPRLIPLELQRLFVQLQELNQRSVSTERKLNLYYE